MNPYYQADGITIYHGDSREILPDLPEFDLLLTDPPYGMSYQNNDCIVPKAKIHGDDAFPWEFVSAIIEKSRCASYVFCRWDNIADAPPPKSCLAWVKNNWSGGDLNHEHGRQWEACLFYPGEFHKFLKRIPDVLTFDRTGNPLHPTQKPLGLMRRIVDANIGEVVFDPFMGSGTTLRAAKDCGRQAIGIELEERYCEIAAERLSQGVLF